MKKSPFHFFAFFNFLAVGWVLYYLAWYFIDYQNKLKAEYIIGAVYVAFFSFPLWSYLLVSSLFRRKNMTKKEIIISLVPAVFMVSVLAGIYLVAFGSLKN